MKRSFFSFSLNTRFRAYQYHTSWHWYAYLNIGTREYHWNGFNFEIKKTKNPEDDQSAVFFFTFKGGFLTTMICGAQHG